MFTFKHFHVTNEYKVFPEICTYLNMYTIAVLKIYIYFGHTLSSFVSAVSNTSRAVSAPRLIFRTELGGADQSLGWKSISESWN